jgi:hypothetical protein
MSCDRNSCNVVMSSSGGRNSCLWTCAAHFEGLSVNGVSLQSLFDALKNSQKQQEAWETSRTPVLTAGGDLEFKIREKIYCEIVQAVHDNDALLSGAVGGAGHSRPPGR